MSDVRDWLRAARRRPLLSPSDSVQQLNVDRAGLFDLLPHRDPLLLLDGLDWFDPQSVGIQGWRTLSPDDPVFAGHFPDTPVYPGVLLIEMTGQLGLCLQRYLADAPTGPARLLKVHEAVFARPALPGDRLTVQARAVDLGDYTAVCIGQVSCHDEVCAVAVNEVFWPGDDS